MGYKTVGSIEFPEFTGARCYMMPFIQGRGDSLPAEFSGYGDIVEANAFPGEEGEIGLITIDESWVDAGKSQRGYGAGSRSIHTEACLSEPKTLSWGPSSPSWGDGPGFVSLKPDLRVLIANSIDDTCMVWDQQVFDTTPDGDLSGRAEDFPREEGHMMVKGELVEISIFTPHECIEQIRSSERSFFRIVGVGVNGREDYFTRNPILEGRYAP